VNLELRRFPGYEAEDPFDGRYRSVHVEVHMVAERQLCSRSVTFDSRSDTLCEILCSFTGLRGRVLGTHVTSMEDPVGEFLGVRGEVLGVFWFSRHAPCVGDDLLIYLSALRL